jgi:signal transduction histidine kinase
LVTAREEERRRLRRDLHDGLGPALAAQTLKVGSARALFARDPAAADSLLADLEHDTEAAIAGIRRLVYDLRPPALDDLGLVGAIRESAAQFRSDTAEGGQTGLPLRITLNAPEQLPPLPAAVEVAVYRIAQEALTNAVRHSKARACFVRIKMADAPRALQLEIADDGIGLPANRVAGVGLTSMRERAEELGGTCVIENRPERGTRVVAWLPLAREA